MVVLPQLDLPPEGFLWLSKHKRVCSLSFLPYREGEIGELTEVECSRMKRMVYQMFCPTQRQVPQDPQLSSQSGLSSLLIALTAPLVLPFSSRVALSCLFSPTIADLSIFNPFLEQATGYKILNPS